MILRRTVPLIALVLIPLQLVHADDASLQPRRRLSQIEFDHGTKAKPKPGEARSTTGNALRPSIMPAFGQPPRAAPHSVDLPDGALKVFNYSQYVGQNDWKFPPDASIKVVPNGGVGVNETIEKTHSRKQRTLEQTK